MAAPRGPLSDFPALVPRPRLLVAEQPISGRRLLRATNRRSAQPRGTMGADEGRSTKWRRRVLPSAPFPLLESDPPPRNTNQSARAAATQQPISGGPVPFVPFGAKPAIFESQNAPIFGSQTPHFGDPKSPNLGQKNLFFSIPAILGGKTSFWGLFFWGGGQKTPFLGAEKPHFYSCSFWGKKTPFLGSLKPHFQGPKKPHFHPCSFLGQKAPFSRTKKSSFWRTKAASFLTSHFGVEIPIFG